MEQFVQQWVQEQELSQIIDAPPCASISSESEDESSDITFTITLDAVSGQDVSVDYVLSDITTITGDDYTDPSSSGNSNRS